MDNGDLVGEQFRALRQEILSRQARMFWTAVIGLLGVPILTYFALATNPLISALLPFFVMVAMVMFLAEQHAMMRAGRYIREHLEEKIDLSPGWEQWLESKSEYRLVERNFFASFLVVFFLYYFLSLAVALQSMWVSAANDVSGILGIVFTGASVTYAVATIWVAYVVLNFYPFCDDWTAFLFVGWQTAVFYLGA